MFNSLISNLMNKTVAPEFDSLWKLMSEHTFVVDPDSINDDFTCGLCRKLMTDACRTTCGCQYCYKCISGHIGAENKYCPGKKVTCKSTQLVLQGHLIREPSINMKIWKLTVLCPNTFCQSKIVLSNMEKHLRTCEEQARTLGGSGDYISQDKVACDLYAELIPHFESMMDNMKNEFGSLRECFNKNNLEMITLKEAERVRINENGKLKEELKRMENKIGELERKLDDERRDRKNQDTVIERNVSYLQQEQQEQFPNLETQLSTRDNDYRTVERKLIYYTNYKVLCPRPEVDFVWLFSNIFTNNRNDQLSSSFYWNDYKFRLGLRIKGDNVAVWCYIIRGDNDHEVAWPMVYPVTLNIMNRDTLLPYRSRTYQYNSYSNKYKWVFKQPRSEMNNCGIGSFSFERYSNIEYNNSVVDDDSIIVSCVFNVAAIDSGAAAEYLDETISCGTGFSEDDYDDFWNEM